MNSIASDLGDLSDTEPFCSFQEDPNNLGLNKDSFLIGSLNVNSLLCQQRISQVESIMKHNNFSVFCLQEVKISDSISPTCYHIDGFTAFAKPRTSRGGGLISYVRSDLVSRQLSYLECKSETLEHLALEVFCQNKRFLIHNFYHPPSGNKTVFLENLSSTLEAIKNNKGWVTCCLGDVNIGNQYCFYNSLNVRPIDLQGCQIFENYNFTNLIDRPTRFSNHSVSLLDLFFVDRIDKASGACVWSNVADHNGISVSFDLDSKRPKQKTFEKYEFNQMTRENWISLKSHLDTFGNPDSLSVDAHCEALSKHLISGIEQFVPKVTYKQRNIDIPWNSAQIRRLLLNKNKTYKCYRTVANQFKILRPDDRNYISMSIRVSQKYEKFKQASKNYKNESRRAKNRYFDSLKSVWANPNIPQRKKFQILQKLSKSLKNNVIPPLLEEGKTISDPQEQAEIFNQYFTGKSNVINPNDTPPILENFDTNDVFDKLDTSHWEIGPIIKSLKSSNHSPCGIPATFIKDAYTNIGSKITKLISDLLNKIFHTGVYPNIWKLAHITPIFKAKLKSDKTNYRPISILPTLSKIAESVIHKRLLDHLISNNIISKHQAAYIPRDSTSQQLLSMIHQIKMTMASNKIAHGVFLDVSSAFDAVWHAGLLRKLEQLNIKGDVLNLFTSYLSQRRAVTTIEGKQSTQLPVNAGVPQGSRLGPLLFLIYINDIVANLESMPFIFADDTTLIATGSSTYETTNILNRDLARISNWAHKWKITFNPQKSKDMIFSKALMPSYPTIMDLHFIERVHLHKHLGVFLTSDLSWDKQIANITKKVNLKLSILWQVNGLSRHCLDVLCKLHVRSSIDYAITVFGPCLNLMQIKKLDTLLYRAAKIVTGAQKFTSRDNLFIELGWENTTRRIEYLCLTQFHKIIHRETTPLIQECLPPLLNSRYPTKRTFEHYPCKKALFENSYFPYVIKKWDGIAMGLKGLDHSEFKIKLKEIYKPQKFRHFNCGYKYPNTLHAQLRLKRSYLNCHLHPIGLSITPACKCGQPLESVKHFLIDCKLYKQAREQLFTKLDGLLEMKVSKYTKSNLCDILLFGEKPHLSEKYQHNKLISYAVQTFLCRTKRLYFDEENKPHNQVLAIPENHADP